MKPWALIAGLAWVFFVAFVPAVDAQRKEENSQRLPVILSSDISETELQSREELLAPGVDRRAVNVASATRRPWVDANGWRFLRHPDGKFYYDLPRGHAVLAAAEAFAYSADVILKVDPSDADDAAKMLAFLSQLPPFQGSTIADIGLVDDGSYEVAEVMNLFARRNLLFRIVESPSDQFGLNVELGSEAFSIDAAAEPSEFAETVRQMLGDQHRSLRIYGTETVLCHLTGDGQRTRLHLLNYGGRDVQGLRVRLRGTYGPGTANAFGQGSIELADVVNHEETTEFSLARVGVYAVVDLPVVAGAGSPP